MPTFIPRVQLPTSLATLTAQLAASQFDPLAKGISQVGQAIGGGIAKRGQPSAQDIQLNNLVTRLIGQGSTPGPVQAPGASAITPQGPTLAGGFPQALAPQGPGISLSALSQALGQTLPAGRQDVFLAAPNKKESKDAARFVTVDKSLIKQVPELEPLLGKDIPTAQFIGLQKGLGVLKKIGGVPEKVMTKALSLATKDPEFMIASREKDEQKQVDIINEKIRIVQRKPRAKAELIEITKKTKGGISQFLGSVGEVFGSLFKSGETAGERLKGKAEPEVKEAQVKEGEVKVQKPDGTVGIIPENLLDEAKKRGWKVIE